MGTMDAEWLGVLWHEINSLGCLWQHGLSFPCHIARPNFKVEWWAVGPRNVSTQAGQRTKRAHPSSISLPLLYLYNIRAHNRVHAHDDVVSSDPAQRQGSHPEDTVVIYCLLLERLQLAIGLPGCVGVQQCFKLFYG